MWCQPFGLSLLLLNKKYYGNFYLFFEHELHECIDSTTKCSPARPFFEYQYSSLITYYLQRV